METNMTSNTSLPMMEFTSAPEDGSPLHTTWSRSAVDPATVQPGGPDSVTPSLENTTYFLENDSSSESVEPALLKIVSGSLTEQVILSAYMLFCLIAIPGLNGFIIGVVWRTPSLRTSKFFFICNYALCDILFAITAYPITVASLILNLPDIPRFICRTHGFLHAGLFFTTSHALGLIAYERYCCFFHPLTYNAHFTRRRMIVLAVLPHVFGQSFSLFIELYIVRHFFTTIMVCNSAGPMLLYLNPIVILVFYLPSAAMTLVCLVRLMLLVKRQRNVVAPIENNPATVQQTLNMRKAFRIVLLVSGTFWGTSVPTFVARTIIFSTGVTWVDMDTRAKMTAYILTRTFFIGMVTLSGFTNPVIYLVMHKDLRRGCRKALGLSVPADDTSSDNAY